MSDKSVDFRFDLVFTIPLVVMALTRIECKGQEFNNGNFRTPENLVTHLYDQVTFPSGEIPDWNYVSPNATVVIVSKGSRNDRKE